jgi:DNA adenine methylase
MSLKAPFSYFGGKSRVAHIVWRALGQPKHYIEPFFGSGAVLLARPEYDPKLHTETVNDKDGFIANVWRALRDDPDEVAKWCDWPVNHADLSARRKRLIENEERILENLVANDEWYDAKLAGYWIWAASCWIGSGLTVGNSSKIPNVGTAGIGVHRTQIPHVSDTGKGVNGVLRYDGLYDWFAALSERLRRVRVVCGDWNRVCGGNWQTHSWVNVGIFFDPPYGVEDRDVTLYHHDGTGIAADVLTWCRERGNRHDHRIVIAGYEEYAELVDAHGWTAEKWSANGGYSNRSGSQNRHRETLYFSPYCIQKEQLSLLEGI